jgi:nucleoside-diphosphate-sugar epimerase
VKALIFGCGYLGRALALGLRAEAWSVAATSRDPGRRKELSDLGLTAVDPGDPQALADQAEGADAVLIAAPPLPSGCPGLSGLRTAFVQSARPSRWVGYASSTRVYGDRGGGWAFEGGALNAATPESARRVAAEQAWLEFGRRNSVRVQIFRLAAIYGPGRSPFGKLRDGSARLVRKPGQVFNRIHVEDAAAALLASIRRPRPGAIYNLADDEPAGADVYVEHAGRLLGLEPPPEADWTDPQVSEAMRRFYLDNKRVSNALAKAELGWRPAHASWRDGLKAVLAVEAS